MRKILNLTVVSNSEVFQFSTSPQVSKHSDRHISHSHHYSHPLMIVYSPRRCTSSSRNTDNQTLYRVPSADDPKSISYVSVSSSSAATKMLRRSSSAKSSSFSSHSSLPVYSPGSAAAATKKRSLSYSLSSPYSSRSSSSPLSFLSSSRSKYLDNDFGRKSEAYPRPSFLAITAIITAIFYAYTVLRGSYVSRQLQTVNVDLRTLLFDSNNNNMALSEAEALEKELKGEIDWLNKEIARTTLAKTIKTSENQVLLNKEEVLRDRIERMEKDIAEISRMEAIERFGEGPHRIEFTLQFMDDNGVFVPEVSKSRTNKFVIELASLSLMPHSVLHFLEMIDHQLWDGAAFVHHVDHVVQAVPTAFRTAETMKDSFDEAKLTELAFQEYHEDYPHDTYSIGFSGRPGGLEFYINTQDNRMIHGPGGQKQHDLHEEGDPCFGKVISGHHVVDRMNQKGVSNKREINIVGIEKAVLIPQGKSHFNPYSHRKVSFKKTSSSSTSRHDTVGGSKNRYSKPAL